MASPIRVDEPIQKCRIHSYLDRSNEPLRTSYYPEKSQIDR